MTRYVYETFWAKEQTDWVSALNRLGAEGWRVVETLRSDIYGKLFLLERKAETAPAKSDAAALETLRIKHDLPEGGTWNYNLTFNAHTYEWTEDGRTHVWIPRR